MDVRISIVNSKGKYQLVHHSIAKYLDSCLIIPHSKSNKGIESKQIGGEEVYFAYYWLSGTDWAVIVSMKNPITFAGIVSEYFYVIIVSVFILLLLLIVVIIRSKYMVIDKYEKDIVKSQLEHASKLATVGELSAGIAHEIGNPLNIIANEIGIMEDYINPKFNLDVSFDDFKPHFYEIMNAVLRCKDINKKLMTFVRDDKLKLVKNDVNGIIEDLIRGFIEKELSFRNIEIIKKLDKDLPEVMIDPNQFRQVIINLLTNAADAIGSDGTITINTISKTSYISIMITDTGSGISSDKIDKIFMPFFTTKSVGKGTGLGLSVSFGIIKNHGGTIKVESIPGKGTTFIIQLPLAQ